MTRSSKRKVAPASKWLVDHCRLTVFPTVPGSIKAEGLWEGLFGEQPSESADRPREGIATVGGEFGNGRLTINVHPMRVDWRYFAGEQEPNLNQPKLGPLPDVIRAFTKPVDRWLRQCPTVSRAAFGAVIFWPASNHRNGYKRLARFLRNIQIDPSSSDFFYQINRRRNYEYDGKTIGVNRLSMWSVLRRGAFGLQLDASRVQAALFDEEQYACRLELDINTVPGKDVAFEGRELAPLFHHLTGLGREIAEWGDIP